jgi:hypothetical protein
MIGQTIAERLCQTKNITARHILQDEAAVFGAQGMISEKLESKLMAAEATDLYTLSVRPYVVRQRVDAFPSSARAKDHILSEASRPVTTPKFNSPEIEWLRGVACVCRSQTSNEGTRERRRER